MLKKFLKTTQTLRKIFGILIILMGVFAIISQFTKPLDRTGILSLALSVFIVVIGVELLRSSKDCSAETAKENRVLRVIYGVILLLMIIPVIKTSLVAAIKALAIGSPITLVSLIFISLYCFVIFFAGILLVLPVQPTYVVPSKPQDDNK